MDLLQSFQRLIDFNPSNNQKQILPVILISTHGGYRIKKKNIDGRVEDAMIEIKLPDGMKIYKLETAAFGVVNFSSAVDVDHLCMNLKKYMHDTRTVQELVNDLVVNVEGMHNENVENKNNLLAEDEEITSFTVASNRRQMNTYQELNSLDNTDPNNKPIFYQKLFSRNIKEKTKEDILEKYGLEEEDFEEEEILEYMKVNTSDLYRFNNSYYDMRINLIEPSFSRLASQYLGPKIQDIYDLVIEDQISYGASDDVVLLSGIIWYMKQKGMNEFIIVDMSCSTFKDMDDNKIELNAKNERLFRSFRRQTSRTSSPIVRVESRNRSRSRSRDRSRNNSFTSLSLDKGGKKRTNKYRNKKSKRKKTRNNKK
jgi:uncharacterized ubiquitin-like protein YukD